jgi:hypothetical protein
LTLSDPTGEEKKCCCCCVDKLEIPQKSIHPLNSIAITDPDTKRKHSVKFYGIAFTVEASLEWKVAKEQKDCTLEWWEYLAVPLPGQQANNWIDQYDAQSGSPTFDGWTKKRKKPCPGKEIANPDYSWGGGALDGLRPILGFRSNSGWSG